MSKINLQIPVAIDPLAVLLPERIYVKVIEGIHPHVPSMKVIEQSIATMTPEEKEFTRNRVKQVMEYVAIVEKSVRSVTS